MALLKSVGATPAQVRRMIIVETAVIAVAATLLAVGPAMLGGRWLLDALISTDQVASSVSYAFGSIAVSMGVGITVVAATGAAILAARRATRMGVTESLMDAAIEKPKMSKKRIVAACVAFAVAIELAVLTMVLTVDQGYESMQTAGSADIFAAIGLAIVAPALIRMVIAVVAGPLQRLGGVAGYLTVQNMRQRAKQMASAVMPIILFTGIGIGTLYMQSIENDAVAAEGLVKTNEQNNIETLNFIVIGMIVAFAAILLINTLIAATVYRSREFGQQRLTGATPGQVLATVALEGVVLTVTGVFFGTIASLFTILPYAAARTDSLIPDVGPVIYLVMVAVAALLTLGVSLDTARRKIRTPAVEAVAVP